jgi:carbohydrate esterase-like sialic acid-specific acetylesterase
LLGATLAASCATAPGPRSPSTDEGAALSPPASAASAPKSASAEVAAGRRKLSPSFVHYDVNHVLATGQSLATGVSGAPPLTRTQPYDNKMFVTGVLAGSEGLDGFVPLVEGERIPKAKYPVETMSSAFANLVTMMAREDLFVDLPPERASHDLLVSLHGTGAKRYSALKKGTPPYATGMAQVAAARDVARRAGQSYVVRAVTNVHGESDHMDGTTGRQYQEDLLEWQADYERDVAALTGQTEPVPMFQSQISTWTRMIGKTATSEIPQAQLGAHVASAGKVVLVGPKYHLMYSRDGVHLTNEGYRHMGEDYAKAYRRVILEGRPWEPVRPVSIARAGATVTVKFAVPSPPIVLDTTIVSDPGNRGFEYADAGPNTPTISSVTVTGPDTVAITLSAEPTAAGGRLRYAHTGVPGTAGGRTSGPRGNLRDSDSTRSRYGNPLYNWCVHFDERIPSSAAELR